MSEPTPVFPVHDSPLPGIPFRSGFAGAAGDKQEDRVALAVKIHVASEHPFSLRLEVCDQRGILRLPEGEL